MIRLTRLNSKEFYVNADMIMFIEETPDTVITFTDGKKIVVSDPAEHIVDEIIEYRRKIYTQLPVVVDIKETGERQD